jgi:hypothetical protein
MAATSDNPRIKSGDGNNAAEMIGMLSGEVKLEDCRLGKNET